METMEEGELIISECEVVEMPLPPLCPHGPTMVFTKEYEKQVKNSKKRKFQEDDSSLAFSAQTKPYYACSATRDPKFCSFRMNQYRWITMRPQFRVNLDARQRDAINLGDDYEYLLDIFEGEENSKTLQKTFAFCYDCCRVLVSRAELAKLPVVKSRTKHCFDLHLTYRCLNVKANLPKSFFAEPTKLMRAATENASQAQYFFADDIAPFVIEEIALKGGFTKVLCIGCPTIHEQILAKYPTSTLSSFLLDIDPRFRQFWPPEQFAKFNMFNYFFFKDTQAVDHLRQFFQSNGMSHGDTLLVIDPPFGGLIECIAETVRKLQMLMTNSDIVEHLFFPPMVLFFPYFNEHWITRAFNGEVLITDQIVQYANHTKFGKRGLPKESEAAKKHFINSTSPVRVFTNINRAQIDLSVLNDNDTGFYAEPFYRWCEHCTRYVFRLNRHCSSCDECTARDASKRYNHCQICNICVKFSWSHCTRCSRCHLKDSPCTI